MPDPTNLQIAEALDELGDLYELDGAIIHRVVAYRNAARAVRDAPSSVAGLVRAGRASDLSGVGATLAQKLGDLVETGDIPAAVKLRAKFPAGLVAMTRIPGLGPKRARLLFDELGIDSPAALKRAAEAQRLRGVKGFGPKAEANILSGLAALEADGGGERSRVLLDRALHAGEAIVAALRAHPAAVRVELAGSARRMADTVKDIDVIATATDPAALAAALANVEAIETVTSSGEAGARARTHAGLAVDLRVVDPGQFGNLLQHFTGSKEHNMALREAAVRRGLHVSEYGILDDADGATTRCATEEEVYARLGYAWIPPELRENRGELEAAAAAGPGLPALVTVDDIRGDLHCHTVASDGHATIAEMAAAATAAGYEYLAITDHSASHGFGNDVSPDELRRQIERVRAAEADAGGIRLLAGSEVNVLPDGALDYDDDLLASLDWVVASVHTSFRMGADAMTARLIAAVEHPQVDAIGHPTGRRLGRRPGYDVDMGAVIAAAAAAGTMLEINANPNRRDIDDIHARAAAAAGATIVIDSDAHRTSTLALMRYGVATARRAWLTAADVANTRSWADLQALRKPARRAC